MFGFVVIGLIAKHQCDECQFREVIEYPDRDLQQLFRFTAVVCMHDHKQSINLLSRLVASLYL